MVVGQRLETDAASFEHRGLDCDHLCSLQQRAGDESGHSTPPQSFSPLRARSPQRKAVADEGTEITGSQRRNEDDRRRTKACHVVSASMRHIREVSSAGRPGDDTNSARSRRRPERPASRDERAARSRSTGSWTPDRARDLAALSSRPARCAARPGLRSSSFTPFLRLRRGSRRLRLTRGFVSVL